MQSLINGIHQFKASIFGNQRELFEQLAKGQTPQTLFITCSDTRIGPNALTQASPSHGELFIICNAGNLAPPHGARQGEETATIEFTLEGPGLRDVIVCGHSHRGAMKGLLARSSTNDLPALTQWLGQAETIRRLVSEKYAEGEGAAFLNVCIQENVLAQLENLRTYPMIASGLSLNNNKLHGWISKNRNRRSLPLQARKRTVSVAGRTAWPGQKAEREHRLRRRLIVHVNETAIKVR